MHSDCVGETAHAALFDVDDLARADLNCEARVSDRMDALVQADGSAQLSL
jgi:hypothetical protein